MTLTVFDAFCGAGGWAEGARALGLSPIGIELDEWACKTARAAGHHVIRQDVTTFSARHLRGRVQGLIASPPCQDFSTAGRRAGVEGETGRLIYEVPRLVSECEPEWIACEQVPSVLPYWREFARGFQRAGYSTWVEKLDAADFGVPQNRERAVLLASRVRDVTAPIHTHAEHPHPVMFGDEPKPWVSIAEALGWGLEDELGYLRGHGLIERHGERPARRASEPAFTITSAGAGGGGGQKFRHVVMRTGANTSEAGNYYERDVDRPAPTVDSKAGTHWHLDTHRDQHEDGSTQTRDLDAPAPAVTGKAGGQWVFERPATTVQSTDRIAKPGHHDRQWNGAIRVTLEELAILQSFPADYPFIGTKSARSLQVGNAIPPLLARAVLSAVTGIAIKHGVAA